MDRWKREENASVDENVLLLFRRDENGHFWKRISVVSPELSMQQLTSWLDKKDS